MIATTDIGKAIWKVARDASRRTISDRTPLLAAALSYRTLFSIIPVMVVGVSVVASFAGPEMIDERMGQMLEYFGLSELELETQVTQEDVESPESSEAVKEAAQGAARDPALEHTSVATWINRLVTRVQTLNFAAIGAVGLALLLYAAISLVVEIERAFNVIYRAGFSRSALSRLTSYWATLTLGPMGLIAGFWTGGKLESSISAVSPALGNVIGALVPFAISWLILIGAYTMMPNAPVAKKAAIGGALVGAALWEASKWAFGLYLSFSTGYATLYGSLGLLPVFLLWVYLTWIIVLFGLQVTYAMQYEMRATATHQDPIDPALALAMVAALAEGFRKGSDLTEYEVARSAGATAATTRRIISRLQRASLVRQTESTTRGVRWTIAKPAEGITAAEVLEAVEDAQGPGVGAAANARAGFQSWVKEGARAETIQGLQPRENSGA